MDHSLIVIFIVIIIDSWPVDHSLKFPTFST